MTSCADAGTPTRDKCPARWRDRRTFEAAHTFVGAPCQTRGMDLSPGQFAPDALIVAVGSGMYPEKQALQIRVSASDAEELVAAFCAEGFEIGPVPTASSVQAQLAVFAVLAGGGSLGGMAAVLRAFFNRHQHRSLLVERDGTRHEMKGMSQRDMDALLDRHLKEAQQRQVESDNLWDEVMGSEEEPKS